MPPAAVLGLPSSTVDMGQLNVKFSVQCLDQPSHKWDIMDDSAQTLFQSFMHDAVVMGRYCPSSISSADHSVAHLPRCPEE